jgi:hypothetical protein
MATVNHPKETAEGQEYWREADKSGYVHKYYRCECGISVLAGHDDNDWKCEGCGWHFCQACVSNTNYNSQESPPCEDFSYLCQQCYDERDCPEYCRH